MRPHQQPERQLHLQQQPPQKYPPSVDKEVHVVEVVVEEIAARETAEDAGEETAAVANTGMPHKEAMAPFLKGTPMA